MIETRLTRLTGVRHPIVCGTMHLTTGPALVAAVAEAGALGLLSTTGYRTVEQLREAVRQVKGLTDRPFGANINLFPGTKPVDIDGFIDVLLDEGVRVIETSGRSPAEFAARIKDGGAVFMHKVARVRDGVKVAGLGADAITIVGYESGGHPGEEDVSLLVQIQALAHAVDVPVIPAGGIADGRGLVAMLALGADGVCMGTRFLATKESPLHGEVKRWIVEAHETDTMLVERTLKNSMRVAKTEVTLRAQELERNGASAEELLALVDGASMQKAMLEGCLATTGAVTLGQTVGLIHDIPTVREVVDRTIAEAEAAAEELRTVVKTDPPA